jgi:hypothetical protein
LIRRDHRKFALNGRSPMERDIQVFFDIGRHPGLATLVRFLPVANFELAAWPF